MSLKTEQMIQELSVALMIEVPEDLKQAKPEDKWHYLLGRVTGLVLFGPPRQK